MRKNIGAHAFWHRAITTHPALAGVDIDAPELACWDGTIFRFVITAS